MLKYFTAPYKQWLCWSSKLVITDFPNFKRKGAKHKQVWKHFRKELEKIVPCVFCILILLLLFSRLLHLIAVVSTTSG